jgi:tetratricopeptide (TPR) repeat protein
MFVAANAVTALQSTQGHNLLLSDFATLPVAGKALAALIGLIGSSVITETLLEKQTSNRADRNQTIQRGMANSLLKALEKAESKPEIWEPKWVYDALYLVWRERLHSAIHSGDGLNTLFPIEVSEEMWELVTRYDAHYSENWLSSQPKGIRDQYSANSSQDAEALADLLWDISDDPESLSIPPAKVMAGWSDDERQKFAGKLLPLYRIEFAIIFSKDDLTSKAVNFKNSTRLSENIKTVLTKLEENQKAVEALEELIRRLGPQPGPKSVSNLQFSRPTHFLGREATLSRIGDTLKTHSAITLTGMAGVGKSTVAIAYADDHRSAYKATWWIRAEDEAGIAADLLSLAVRLGWVKREEREDTPVKEVLNRLLSQEDQFLLIYDNAIDKEIVCQNLPRGGSAHTLITSRERLCGKSVERIDVEIWPSAVGADYLLKRVPVKSDRNREAEALALAERLGGLPLAIEVAAAYCDEEEISFAEFQGLFDQRGLELFRDEFYPADYHNGQSITSAFGLAIDEATKCHSAAKPLIEYLASLAAAPIPRFLFEEGLSFLGEPLASQLAGVGLSKAISALRKLALIDRVRIKDEINAVQETDCVQLHRLVREVAAKRCVDGSRELIRAGLLKAIAALYPDDDDFDVVTNWFRARRLDALAYELIGNGAALPPGCELEASVLMEKVALYRNACTPDLVQARSLQVRALKIRESIEGAESTAIARLLTRLGLLSWWQGELEDALLQCERSLDMRKRLLDANDPDLGGSHQNLARLRLARKERVEARKHCNQALAIFEARGHEQANVATSLTILGHIEKEEDCLPAAQELFEEAGRIYEKTLSANHPAYATSLLNLAEVLEGQGKVTEAREYLERALGIYIGTMGPDHRLVGNCLAALAGVLEKQGERPTALAAAEKALGIYERWYGVGHAICLPLRGRIDGVGARG